MAETQPRYRAFLLRLWQERSGGQWVWRASLEDSHTHTRKGFSRLEELSAFLWEIFDDAPTEES